MKLLKLKTINNTPLKEKKQSSSLPKKSYIQKIFNRQKKIKKEEKKETTNDDELNDTLDFINDMEISMIDEKDEPEQVKEDEDVDLWAQMIERTKKGKRKFHFFDEEPKVEDNKTELLKIINNIEGKQEEAELNRANSSNSIRRKSTKYVTMKPSVSHKATSKFRRRNGVNLEHQLMRTNTMQAYNAKQRIIKLKTHSERKKFFLDNESPEEIEKRKQMLLLKIDQNIKYGLTTGDYNDTATLLFEELKKKIENLKSMDDKTYIMFLENNFSYLEQKLDNIKKMKEEERRINEFLLHLNNNIEVKKMVKQEKSSHRVIDGRVVTNTSKPFVVEG